MGIFDKITKGITRGIGNAVSNAAQKAVERKASEVLTPKINQAADTIAGKVEQSYKTAEKTQTASNGSSSLEMALGNLNVAVNAYANKTAQNMKVCSKCNKPTTADKTFCPECGERLPEGTLADGALCSNCGKQNAISEKFCSGCGAKLPLTLQAEEKSRLSDDAVLSEWRVKLIHYPVWQFGGTNLNIDENDGYIVFSAKYPSYEEGSMAIEKYRELLLQNGFRQAGQYPSKEHLYKKVDGVCYHVDTEHCFEGDADCPSIAFDKTEPRGGYDYVKPEPKKKGLFGLFG